MTKTPLSTRLNLHHLRTCVSAFADVCTCELTFTSRYHPETGPTTAPINRPWLCVLPFSFPASLLHPQVHLFFTSVVSLYSSLLCLLFFVHPSIFQSPFPFSSPRQMVCVSLGWLWNQRCNSFFFFSPPSLLLCLSLSLPSLILVSSHCGAFNASYHMVAESSWRCGGAFIGASKHSCNNARQGSGFFITLMLYRVDPSSPSTPSQTRRFSLFLNTEPQIGGDSLLEGGNHKPHNACDVMRWPNARRTRRTS